MFRAEFVFEFVFVWFFPAICNRKLININVFGLLCFIHSYFTNIWLTNTKRMRIFDKDVLWMNDEELCLKRERKDGVFEKVFLWWAFICKSFVSKILMIHRLHCWDLQSWKIYSYGKKECKFIFFVIMDFTIGDFGIPLNQIDEALFCTFYAIFPYHSEEIR